MTHGLDVVPSSHRDAVLGALELILQREEILVGLDVGVALDDDHQSRQRGAQALLRLDVGL